MLGLIRRFSRGRFSRQHGSLGDPGLSGACLTDRPVCYPENPSNSSILTPPTGEWEAEHTELLRNTVPPASH